MGVGNFLAELKRRNVYRVAVAYAISSWFLLQVAGSLTPILELPEWVPRFVFLILFVGLIPALIAAWALEMTPDGIRLEKDVDRSGPQTGGKHRGLNYFIIGILTLTIVLLVVERVFIADIAKHDAVVDVAVPEKSIAVLPFDDFSQGQGQDWFADGLAEEILNALARTPDLVVSSRTSSFSYKGSDKDASTIGKELNVAHVMEGSIRGTPDRIRVTAQLIRVSDGFHVWSQTYDRDGDDVIGVQEDVAARIASALQTTMDPAALEDMMRVGTRSASAYRTYIRGLAQRTRSLRAGDRDLFLDAYQLFEEARRIDPRFALAHRAAANFWKVQLSPNRLQAGLTELPAQQIMDNFIERIDLAIDNAANEVDAEGSRAHKATVQLRLRTAIRRFEAYLEERPNDFGGWSDLLIVALMASDKDAALKALGRLEEAGAGDRSIATMYVNVAYRLGSASRGADYGLRALERWPNDAAIAYVTHRSLLWAGRTDEAARLLARSLEIAQGTLVMRARQACAEGRRDDVLEYLDALQQAGNSRVADQWLVQMMLGEVGQANDLLEPYATSNVPYQLASWLTYHHFDPAPFPSLVQMLEREAVNRPPALPVPFACPAN